MREGQQRGRGTLGIPACSGAVCGEVTRGKGSLQCVFVAINGNQILDDVPFADLFSLALPNLFLWFI